MIKLFDSENILEKICFAEPYLGSVFTANGSAFLSDPDLMNVWVETDGKGSAISAAMIDSETIGIISGKKGPGSEMLFFVSKVAEGGSFKTIMCNEYAFEKVYPLFPGSVRESALMKCSRHICVPDPGLPVRKSECFDDLIKVIIENGEEDFTDLDTYKLKMVRGKQHGMVDSFLCYDGDRPVSTATIRGRSAKYGAIANVMTLPPWRHRGLASYLTAYCAETLRSEGRTATLEPVDENVQKMYESLGFVAYSKKYTITLDKDSKNE